VGVKNSDKTRFLPLSSSPGPFSFLNIANSKNNIRKNERKKMGLNYIMNYIKENKKN